MDNNQEKIREDLDKTIKYLKIEGIEQNTPTDTVGLGDLVESALSKAGITQERYKELFGLSECNCTERKKFLNNLFSWHRKTID